MGIDIEKLKELNRSGMIVNIGLCHVNFNELRKRVEPELQSFIDDYEVIHTKVKEFKEKYPEIYK